MQQLPLGVRIPDRAVFESYFAGPNAQAVEYAMQVATGAPASTDAAPVWANTSKARAGSAEAAASADSAADAGLRQAPFSRSLTSTGAAADSVGTQASPGCAVPPAWAKRICSKPSSRARANAVPRATSPSLSWPPSAWVSSKA